jgi:hypothetical protein
MAKTVKQLGDLVRIEEAEAKGLGRTTKAADMRRIAEIFAALDMTLSESKFQTLLTLGLYKAAEECALALGVIGGTRVRLRGARR